MGLDMYLEQHHHYGGKYRNEDSHSEGHTLTVKGDFIKKWDIKRENISHIVEEVAYWRKANQIHGWFIENVCDGEDECRSTWVEPEKLQELVDICYKVLKALDKKNYKRAETLLPPMEGFFFGAYNIKDQWYRDDIEHTIKEIEPILQKNRDVFSDFYYIASW